MKKYITPITCLAFSTTVSFAATTWIGGTLGDENNYYNSENWSSNLPSVANPGTISSGTPGADGSLDVTNNNGEYITIETGGTLVTATAATTRFQNFSTINLNGGTLSIGSGNTFQLGGDTDLNLNGGLVTSSSGTATMWTNSTSAAININSTTTFTGVDLWHRLGSVTIDNSTLTLGTYDFVQGSNDAFLTLQNGSTLHATTQFDYAGNPSFTMGQISFGNGANSLRAATWNDPENMNFDFAPNAVGSTIVIDSGFYDLSEWQTKWGDGTLTVDGANTGNFSDYFSVSGNTLTLAAVPEPSSFALLGGILSLAIAAVLRRK